jgi:hypothetical protein
LRFAVNDITLGLEAMVCTITPFDILARFLLLGECFVRANHLAGSHRLLNAFDANSFKILVRAL